MLQIKMFKNITSFPDEKKAPTPFSLARLTLCVTIALIIFASLTPFNFEYVSLDPLSWITAPLPKYIPLFDVEVNILGYLPLGFLAVLALYPRWVKWPAFLLSLLFGLFVSASLESAQSFLSTRVANLTDFYANGLGTFIGALLAITINPVLLSKHWTGRFRNVFFGKNQEFFLLLAIFPLAQIFPQNVWLGMGDWHINFLRISPYWTRILSNTTQEILIATLAVVSTSAFMMTGIRRQAPKLKVILGVIAFSAFLKFAMSELQYGSFDVKHWISVANGFGIALGFIIAIIIRNYSRSTHWVIAIIGFILLLIVVNILPQNPYYLSQVQLLPQGRLKHFNGLLEWLTMVWPLLGIVVLIKQYKIVQTSFSKY